MQIFLDADASPKPVKEILFRIAMKRRIKVYLVANQWMQAPRSPFIESIVVSSGFDEADNKIVEMATSSDIVVTSDVPLANEVIEKGATVVDFRGNLLTTANIKSRLSMRNFMEELRSSGVQTGGQRPFGKTETLEFANQIDRLIAGMH